MPLRSIRILPLVASLLLVVGCAHSPPSDPQDPLESVNRGIFSFNQTADRYVLRPVAKGYATVTPDPVERSITNFFDNIRYPITIINSFLQLKLASGTSDIGRFLINRTLGVAGLFDVATHFGLEEHDEDFGQTLGYWGLGQGIFLMAPFLGPTTGRDGVGRVVDGFANPLYYLEDDVLKYSLYALYFLNLRASLLGFDKTIESAFDPYLFIRGAYLEDRLNAVYDGDPPEELQDPGYDFEADDDFDAPAQDASEDATDDGASTASDSDASFGSATTPGSAGGDPAP